MRIYSSVGEASIQASVGEFADLKAGLEKFIASPESELTLVAEEAFDPKPYDSLLNVLVVRKSESALCIQAEGSALCVVGPRDGLALFAANLPYDANDHNSGIQYHVHFDHAGWPSKIAPDSIELVLCVQRVGG